MGLDDDDDDIIEQSKPKGRGNAKVFYPIFYYRLESHTFTASQATYALRNSAGLFFNGYRAPHCCRATRPNKEGRKEGCGTTIFILAGYQRREYPLITYTIFSWFLQKDGVRPGEEGYDPRTLYVPKDAWKTLCSLLGFISVCSNILSVLGN